MKHSDLAVDLIIKSESNGSGRPYLSATVDELGRASVGYGHTINGRLFIVPMSAHDCIDLLKEDLAKWEEWVNNKIHHRSIEQHQFDALLCWAFHVGQGRAEAHGQEFEHSLLMQFAFDGKMQLAAAEFDNWVLVRERPSKKLLARRQAEKYLFLYGSVPFAI